MQFCFVLFCFVFQGRGHSVRRPKWGQSQRIKQIFDNFPCKIQVRAHFDKPVNSLNVFLEKKKKKKTFDERLSKIDPKGGHSGVKKKRGRWVGSPRRYS